MRSISESVRPQRLRPTQIGTRCEPQSKSGTAATAQMLIMMIVAILGCFPDRLPCRKLNIGLASMTTGPQP